MTHSDFLLGKHLPDPYSVFLKKATKVWRPLQKEGSKNPKLAIRHIYPSGCRAGLVQDTIFAGNIRERNFRYIGIASHKDDLSLWMLGSTTRKGSTLERKPTQVEAHWLSPAETLNQHLQPVHSNFCSTSSLSWIFCHMPMNKSKRYMYFLTSSDPIPNLRIS